MERWETYNIRKNNSKTKSMHVQLNMHISTYYNLKTVLFFKYPVIFKRLRSCELMEWALRVIFSLIKDKEIKTKIG